MNEVQLGVALKLALEELGHSEFALSRRANVKQSLVSAALKGSGCVPIAAWCRMARALEREVELVPSPPHVRPMGLSESVVDLALRRIGVDSAPTAAVGDASVEVQVDELENLAKAIFASADEAAVWLRRPHPMLEGQSPFECAKSGAGARRVKDMLLAIKYGGVA